MLPLLFLFCICTFKLCVEAVDLTNSYQPQDTTSRIGSTLQTLSLRVKEAPSVKRKLSAFVEKVPKIYNSSPNMTLEIHLNEGVRSEITFIAVLAEGNNKKQSFESSKDFTIQNGPFDQIKSNVKISFKSSM
jgi:hypothetical protein